jgi:hypothetical protein
MRPDQHVLCAPLNVRRFPAASAPEQYKRVPFNSLHTSLSHMLYLGRLRSLYLFGFHSILQRTFSSKVLRPSNDLLNDTRYPRLW